MVGSWSTRKRKIGVAILVAVVLTTAAAGTITLFTGTPDTHITAHFESAVGLHPGDEVRILGIRVGQIANVRPGPKDVEVDLSVEGGRRLPADVKAAILAPSLVSGRYVQLAPVYTGGSVLRDGAVIPVERTAVPVEWDQIKDELNTLSQAVGPNPSDPEGALARLVNSAATNLSGNGQTLHDTFAAMRQAAKVLGENAPNLFDSIRNLSKFVSAMNANSEQLRQFTSQLRSIATVVNDNRIRLGRALAMFDDALRTITEFIKNNKDRIKGSVDQLADVAVMLQTNQTALANVVHALPGTLANFYNLYDPDARAFGGRAALPYASDVPSFICQAIYSAGGSLNDCRGALRPYLEKFDRPDLRIAADILPGQGTLNQVNAADLPPMSTDTPPDSPAATRIGTLANPSAPMAPPGPTMPPPDAGGPYPAEVPAPEGTGPQSAAPTPEGTGPQSAAASPDGAAPQSALAAPNVSSTTAVPSAGGPDESLKSLLGVGDGQ